jgi:hypothetical protein
MPDIEIFDLWRYLLTTVVTIYVAVYMLRTLWSWLIYFRSSRRTTVMGHYALVLLLRARVRRFDGEMLAIGLLLMLLGAVVGLHWVIL